MAAARTRRTGLFRATDQATGSELFQVNFFSAAEILRLLVNRAVNAGALRAVVFISSGASIVGEKGNAMYAASKGALDAFMRSAARECSSGRLTMLSWRGISTALSTA